MEQSGNEISGESKAEYPIIDSTIIKLFLNSIKDGNLQGIKNSIEKYNFNVKAIKDPQLEQTVLFYAAVIPDDIT